MLAHSSCLYLCRPREEELDISPRGRWIDTIVQSWDVTEEAAHKQMDLFVREGVARYERDRARVDIPLASSRLSPYLKHGLLSPRALYWRVEDEAKRLKVGKEWRTFRHRLLWREVAYFQLKTFPDLPTVGVRTHYDQQRWTGNLEAVEAWRRGRTGYPLVDAAMRELWATGWIQQNMRMVVASFLIEFLGEDWRHGMRWFHDTLVDNDLAINSMMWQNAGHSGVDQWNFVLLPENGKSRDPKGIYVRKWCPELKDVPLKYLFTPWLHSSSYTPRIVMDLQAAKARSFESTLELRRANPDFVDSNGYDIIVLPTGQRTRVFTKREFRSPATGTRSSETTPNGKRKSNPSDPAPIGQRQKVQKSMDVFVAKPASAPIAVL